jgi:hypothetical protein
MNPRLARLSARRARALHKYARRAILAAIVARALLLPVIVALAVFLSYKEISDVRSLLPGWTVLAFVAVVTGFRLLKLGLLLFFELGQDASGLLAQRPNADPIPRTDGKAMLLLTGEVLRRQEAEGESLFWLIVGLNARWLDVDVWEANVIDAGGSALPAPGLLGPHRLTASRHVHRHSRYREQATILCSPGGRALRIEPH